MNLPTPSSPTEKTLRDLDVGTRIGFLVVTVLLALLAARLAWLFTDARAIFSGLLKGQTLPLATQWAVGAGHLWLQFSAAIPVGAAILGLTIQRPLWALLTIAGCNLALGLLIIFLTIALVDPFVLMIKAMT